MFRVTFVLHLDEGALIPLLECLTRLNQQHLEKHPKTPMLYDSGVRYNRERVGQEKWLTIPAVLRARIGDCEDLACWRAAELRARGIDAAPVAVSREIVSGDRAVRLYHIQVRTPNGIEDPSRKLGM